MARGKHATPLRVQVQRQRVQVRVTRQARVTVPLLPVIALLIGPPLVFTGHWMAGCLVLLLGVLALLHHVVERRLQAARRRNLP